MTLISADLVILNILTDLLRDVQEEKVYLIDEAFSMLGAEMRADIKEYISDLVITNDHTIKSEERQVLYVLPNQPLIDLPFPQIGISVGNESTSDRFLGNDTGEDGAEVHDNNDEIIAWDIQKALLENGSWFVDVLANTKLEVIWIATLCKLAIFRNFETLEQNGVLEVDVVTQDIMYEKEHNPQHAFARRVTVQGKLVQTWTKRVDYAEYQTGVNLAQDEKP